MIISKNILEDKRFYSILKKELFFNSFPFGGLTSFEYFSKEVAQKYKINSI